MFNKLSYGVGEIAENYNDGAWWRSRFENRVIAPAQRRLYGAEGISVMDEHWDTLIILDACRADLFESVVGTDQFDLYSRVKSAGSSTPEWTQANFAGREFGDTVYVTGNPQTSKYAAGAFHDLIEVWDGAFNDGIRTVFPEDMYEAAVDAHAEYPNKRIVVHFMQPHPPFVNRDVFFRHTDLTEADLDEADVELKTMVEETSRDIVWEAFADNLNAAYPYVEQLLDELDGRLVVSADHGDLLGEWGVPVPVKLYGHPSGIRHPALVEVPWAVTEGPRREIVDDGVSTATQDMDKIESHLRDLGYK